jgi:Tol biopolymer transport system component
VTVRRALGVSAALFFACGLWAEPGAQTGVPAWSEPVNLGAPINSAQQENTPSLSSDGLSLYFSSNRQCGAGDTTLDMNLWVGRRSAPGMPWQVECLAINLDGYIDSAPDLSPDGHWLYFASDRPGSSGIQRDIWVSRRDDVRNDRAWGPPANVGPPVTTNAPEIGPSYFVIREARYFRLLPKQKLMFSRTTAGNFDLWEVNMLDDLAFGSATRIGELSTEEFWESGPSVSPNGLEILFNRAIPNGPFDIYFSSRREPDQPWSTPVSLGAPVNMSASSDAGATRSPDGRELYFESNRPGGLGNTDIWMSSRIAAQ